MTQNNIPKLLSPKRMLCMFLSRKVKKLNQGYIDLVITEELLNLQMFLLQHCS